MRAVPGATGDAARYYDVGVVAHRRDGAVRRSARRLGSLVAGLSSGFLPAPSVGDLVVTRRGSGVELSRTAAGDAHAAPGLLAQARADLLTLSVEDFARRWGLGPRL